jgi:hypothetical protein
MTGREWLFLAALVLLVFLVYEPAWQGGILWDDEAHVTKPELRSWHGLYRTWFQIGPRCSTIRSCTARSGSNTDFGATPCSAIT